MRLFLTYITLFVVCAVAAAQTQSDMPKAFLIGDNEEYYEQLVATHGDQLLSVCSNSMDKAYQNWTNLLLDLESYAEEREFDIKGTKIWINVFWSDNGEIDNIVYYPKPNSKNMDFQLLSDFLSDFATVYQFTLTNESAYSHYGSASFPVFSSFAIDK